MSKFLCPGERIDDEGTRYCPWDPGTADYDCDECRAGWDRYQDLLAEMDAEAKRDTWG